MIFEQLTRRGIPFEYQPDRKVIKGDTFRACKAELADGWKPEFIPGGFSAHCTNQSDQKWNIEEDEEGRVVELSLRRVKFKNPNLPATHRECWVPVGSSPDTIRWVAGRRKFHDYNF